MNRIGLKRAIVFVTLIAVFGSVALAAEAGPGRRGRFGSGNGRALAQDPNQAVPDRPMRNRGMRLGRGPRAEQPGESVTTDNANVPENHGRGYGRGFNRNQGQDLGRGRGQQAEPGQGRGRYFRQEMNRESEQQAGPGPGARIGRGRAFRRYQEQDEQQQTRPGARLGRGQGFGRGDIQGRLGRNPGRQDGQGQRVRLGRRHRFGRGQQELQGPNEQQRLRGPRRKRGRGDTEIRRPGLMRERGGSARWYSYEYWRQIPERFLGRHHGRRQDLSIQDDETQREQTTRPRRPMRGQERFWEE